MIVTKNPSEIQKMRVANGLVAEILNELGSVVRPGMTTKDLDVLAEERVRAAGAVPAFKGYHGFPSTLCTSINDEVVHGIPSDRGLKSGDVVSIDLGVVVEGFYGDSAVTLAVGTISDEAEMLLRVTQESLNRSISKAQPGGYVSDLGHAVQHYVESNGYSVVREFVGHGIGTNLHEEPQIPNYGKPGQGVRLTEGMVLAIEPMVNAGGAPVKVLEDGWTAVTKDGSLSAHFEHTVAITEDGPLVLSQLPDSKFVNGGVANESDQRLVSAHGA
tara:strand:- start:44 stop:862 length:819 start_codon:yes stop_codon:yes gene_type:complete